MLGLEDTGCRMSRLGKAELLYGDLLTRRRTARPIDSVTVDDVQGLAAELLSQADAFAVVGPFDESAFSHSRLTWDAVTIVSALRPYGKKWRQTERRSAGSSAC